MLNLAFCMTAMNRKPSVERSLPHNLRCLAHHPAAFLLLLDYNSNDGLQELIQSEFADAVAAQRVVYCRTTEPQYFHMSHAKNVAHRVAISERPTDILINTDAEMLLPEAFCGRLEQLFSGTTDYVYTNHNGRIAVRASRFLELGGYDETFEGWGAEDNDFRHRAQRLGLTHLQESSGEDVAHSDALRTKCYPPHLQDIGATTAANFGRFQANNRSGIVAANLGRRWGAATVLVNWARTVSL